MKNRGLLLTWNILDTLTFSNVTTKFFLSYQKKILECWISIFSEIQVKFGFFKNMIYGLSLCVFLWPKKQTFLKVLCLESEEERHFGMHQSEFFKYEFIVKTRKTLMIFKSAELASATVPWHWLFFCLASKGR